MDCGSSFWRKRYIDLVIGFLFLATSVFIAVSHIYLQSKPDQKKKVWRESETEKHSGVQVSNPVVDDENHHSSEQHDYSHDEEVF